MTIRAFRLGRFRRAQDLVIAEVIIELSAGMKSSHWMWFVFPQAKGLGTSDMSKRYALSDGEAKAYLADPILGSRLRLCTAIVMSHLEQGRSLELIFGDLDALKFRSCMRLFDSISNEPLFAAALKWTES